jgi:hypothetical protein
VRRTFQAESGGTGGQAGYDGDHGRRDFTVPMGMARAIAAAC